MNRDSFLILFHTQNIRYRVTHKRELKNWISRAIQLEGKSVGSLAIIFCNDEYLLQVNREYLKHDTFTDIITFDHFEPGKASGDIFISIDRVRENAIQFKVLFEEELHRVIIHGIMHLCGFKDKKESDIALMRGKEDYYLANRPDGLT